MADPNAAPELLRQAVQFLRQGDTEQARPLIVQAIKLDPSNADAWYMVSFTASNTREQILALGRALKLNPDHQRARERLDNIRATDEGLTSPDTSTTKVPPPSKDPLTSPDISTTRVPPAPKGDKLTDPETSTSKVPPPSQKDKLTAPETRTTRVKPGTLPDTTTTRLPAPTGTAQPRRSRTGLIIGAVVLLLVLVGGGIIFLNRGPSQPGANQQTIADADCPVLVSSALDATDTSCTGTGINQVCYGNIRLNAVLREGVTNVAFEAPGDTLDFTSLQRLNLSSMNTLTKEWGVALMRLQAANLEGTLPGQAITILLFGNVEISNTGQPTDVVQSFYFRSGVGDAPCAEAPDSGILVQTPQGERKVALRINEVDIQLGSTAFMQAEPSDDMEISVIEGQAVVSAQGVTETVNAGLQTGVSLDSSGKADGPPEPPAPYDSDTLRVLPVTNLIRSVGIAKVLLNSTFAQDEEGWGIFNDGTPITYNPADATSDGFICSDDTSQGVWWYFQSPTAWAGDYSEAYDGNLSFTLKQSADKPEDDAEDVFLTGGGLTLSYDTPENPGTDWTTYIVPLNESGWLNEDGSPATRDQMLTVLQALAEVKIRGEYFTGGDTGCLDSAQLISIVEPVARSASARPTVTPLGPASSTRIGFQVSDSLNAAGEVKTYEFTAEPGQTVFLDSQSDSPNTLWKLTDETGASLSNAYFSTNGDPGFQTLVHGGKYTITVYTSDNTSTGPFQFQVWDAPVQTFDLQIGGEVADGQPAVGAGNIETPGVRDIYTFTAEAGQTVYFDAQSDSGDLLWRLMDDTGASLFNGYIRTGGDPGFQTLERGGGYTITVYSGTPYTGTYQFQIWDAPVQTFDYEISDQVSDGQPAAGAGNIETSGVRDIYTFSAEPGQTVYFDAQSDSGDLLWRLMDSAGASLFNGYIRESGDPGFQTLESGGEYTITVYAGTPYTGTYQFQIWDAPVENFEIGIGDVVSDGQPASGAGNIETAGGRDIYTFTAETGQTVYFDAQSDSGDLLWRLTDNTGASLFNGFIRETGDPGFYRLEQGGTYTITVYASTPYTGTYQFQIWDAPVESFEIGIGDVVSDGQPAPGAGNIETPGVRDVYTFTAQPGQTLFFDAQSDSGDLLWRVTDETGGSVFNAYIRANSDPGNQTLQQGGTYTITVYASTPYTGTYQFQITPGQG